MKNKKNTGQVASSAQLDSVSLETDNDISKVDGVEICDEMSEKPEKTTDKQKNLAKENINTSNNNFTMNDKSDNVFDKLYQSLMEADELPSMDDDMFSADEPESDGLDGLGGDEGGEDTVTLNLPREVAQQLCDALNAEMGAGEDDELEDLDGGEDEDPFASGGEDDPFQDSIEVVAEPKPLPETNLKSGNNSSMDNKPKTSGYGKSGGGKANSGSIPEPKGDPSELSDSAMKKGNNSSMDNKVNAGGYNTGEYIK